MAVANIVDNASKYTHEGGTITVSSAQNGANLELTVADSGVGIPENELEDLFGKFNRIPNELSDKVGGSGLGLYWAQRIIVLHGSELDVKSRLNQGTTFTIKLPIEG
jgi:signal transduction histidine kinase